MDSKRETSAVQIPKKRAARKLSWFTLVELIVVITILAILATIGFLSLSGYSSDAKGAAVQSNVRSVHTAISSESAITGNSPRYYVVHDAAAALTGAAVAYVDGLPVKLVWGDWNKAGTNYSAGNPDWAKLKLNPKKFRLSSVGSRLATAFGTAAAAYDPTLVSVGALDAELAETVNGSARSTSFFQVMGTAPDTGASIVSGDFPAPTVEQISAGAVTELVNLSTSSSSGSLANQYPGCDTPDIVLANGQRWAACNVGSTTAYAGQAYPTDAAPTDAQKAYLGALFQWGRNEDVTSLGTGSTLASSGSTSSTALGIFVTNGTGSYDWISTRNDNLWWGGVQGLNGYFTGQTAPDQALMMGPCAQGYHIPTHAEWYDTIKLLWPSSGVGNTLAATLKLPLAGFRDYNYGYFDGQGTYGRYWTSKPAYQGPPAYDDEEFFAYFVELYKDNPVYRSTYHSASRAFGLSVRCIAN